MEWGTVSFIGGIIVILAVSLAAVTGCITPINAGPSAIPATPPPSTTTATTTTTVPFQHGHIPFMSSRIMGMFNGLPNGVPLYLPQYLPEGFFFEDGSLTDEYRVPPLYEGVCHVSYRRGQEENVFLEQASRNSTACKDAMEYFIPGSEGVTNQRGYAELRWGSDGRCFVLASSLSREEMEKIARSVKPVIYAKGDVPLYEYQPPAHPLIRNFSMYQNVTTNKITITFESLACDAKACIAAVRLGVPPPQAASGSPMVTLAPANPKPHVEWRVDGGRPLRLMNIGFSYRPEGDTTAVFWNIEPLPEDSRELTLNISRVNGIYGPWLFTVPLTPEKDTSSVIPTPQETAS